MLKITPIIVALLSACSTGEIRRSIEDGIPLVEHIDTNDQPDGCPRRYTGGCFQARVVNGKVEKHIWRSSVGAPYVERHEKAHKGDSKTPGMRHTAWSLHHWYNANCATITVGYSGYPQGHLLCNDGRTEWTIAP